MRQTFEDRVVAKQADRISAQQEQIGCLKDSLEFYIAHYKNDHKAARYWFQLQKLLVDHPMLYDEWLRFMAFVHLNCDPKEAPGFTCEDTGYYLPSPPSY